MAGTPPPPPCAHSRASLPRQSLSHELRCPSQSSAQLFRELSGQSRLALESERDSRLVGAGLGSASVVSVPAEEAPCPWDLGCPSRKKQEATPPSFSPSWAELRRGR